MPKINRVPFTELFERVQNELVRDKSTNSATEYKYKGAVNEVYMNDLVLLLEQDLLRKQAYVSTIADYSTGTITAAAAASAATGASTAWTSANSNDSLLKANGEDHWYRVAYSSSTSLTLSSPSAWVDTAVSAGDYRLIFDRYALASDFSYMCIDDVHEPECVYRMSGGSPAFLTPLDPGQYDTKFHFTHGTPGEYTVKRIAGSPYIYLNPAPTDAEALFYNYIPALTAMSEYTTGTITTLAAAGTAVTGSGTAWSTTSNIDTSAYTYYFRIDADGVGSESQWYLISSADSATGITLATGYGGTAISSGTSTYTISRISQWPARVDAAMIYGAAMKVEPSNPDKKVWAEMFSTKITGLMSLEGKKIYGQQGAFYRK